jgi:hypothetical protein
MGLFDFLKKAGGSSGQKNQDKFKIVFTETIINGKRSKLDHVELPTDLEHLTKDGDLPFGWVSRNKEFTDKIQSEYSYLLNLWLDNRSKSPWELYGALKSFIMYLEDVEKLCKSKGECFEFWFYAIIASADYIDKRNEELKYLVENMDSLQKEYEMNSWKEKEKQKKIIEIKPSVILLLKENDGILQSDFWKLFDDEICRMAASDIVYTLIKEGKIERTKSGRSYILHYKG